MALATCCTKRSLVSTRTQRVPFAAVCLERCPEVQKLCLCYICPPATLGLAPDLLARALERNCTTSAALGSAQLRLAGHSSA